MLPTHHRIGRKSSLATNLIRASHQKSVKAHAPSVHAPRVCEDRALKGVGEWYCKGINAARSSVVIRAYALSLAATCLT